MGRNLTILVYVEVLEDLVSLLSPDEEVVIDLLEGSLEAWCSHTWET